MRARQRQDHPNRRASTAPLLWAWLAGAAMACAGADAAADGTDAAAPFDDTTAQPADTRGASGSRDSAGAADVIADAAAVTATAADGAAAADAAVRPYCPGPAPPAADAATGIGPMPAPLACQAPLAELFKGVAPGPASVQVELGVNDVVQGAFVPYQLGQWAPMVHGFQGGFHVNVAIRLRSKALQDPKLKVQAELRLYDGCGVVGHGVTPMIWPQRDAGGDYLFPPLESSGVELRFLHQDGTNIQSGSSQDFCNRWYLLRAVVREWKSGAWGETTVTLRTYDTPAPAK